MFDLRLDPPDQDDERPVSQLPHDERTTAKAIRRRLSAVAPGAPTGRLSAPHAST